MNIVFITLRLSRYAFHFSSRTQTLEFSINNLFYYNSYTKKTVLWIYIPYIAHGAYIVEPDMEYITKRIENMNRLHK